jgi:hypothetical protein
MGWRSLWAIKGNRVKVHKLIKDGIDENIKKRAIEVGLNQLDFDKTYRLYKVGSKHSFNIVDVKCVGAGEIRLMGSDHHVTLFISGLREWYRTSPIFSCQLGKDKYIIETVNSYYELVEDE